MNVAKKIARSTVIQLVGRVVTTVISLFTIALITRNLGLASYGDFTTAMAYGQFFAIFADLGVNVYLIKRLSTDRVDEGEETGNMFALRLMTTTIVLLLALILMLLLPYTPTVRLGIVIVIWAVFAQSINQLYVSILQSKLEMPYAVLTDILGRIVILLLTLLAISLGKGIIWMLGAVTVGAAFNMGMSHLYARRFVKFGLRWDWEKWKVILRESLPISISAILYLVYFKIDTVILSALPLEGGRSNAVEVGIYGSAYKVVELLLIVPGIFLGNLFPLLSAYISRNDERLRGLLQKSFDLLAYFGLPITAVVFMYSDKIMRFIAGEDFVMAGVPLRVLSFAVLLSYFTGYYAYIAFSLNKQKVLSLVYAVAAIFNVIANFIFIPHFSYLAAAYITLLTQVVVLAGTILITREIRSRVSLRKSLQVLGVTGLLIGLMYFLQDLNLFLSLAIIMLAYLILLFGAKIASPQDLKNLWSKD